MELQEVIEKRQSIRRYKDGDIPEAHIRQIVQAAAMAPSGKNIQNWHFVAIKNKTLIDKVAKAIFDKNEMICLEMDKVDKDKEKGNRFRKFCKNLTLFFTKAPVLVIVYTTVYYPSGYHEYELIHADPAILSDLVDHKSPGMQSLGAAVENFTLKAIDLGYGTCWLTSANYASTEIEALLKQEIGFEKEGYYMGCMISMGIPEDSPKSPTKKPIEEVYTFVE